jgi:hypothetical protein
MASNKIQIKRSTANAVVTGLSAGELAFTQASNTLWIGTPDGLSTISIAGQRFPGVLTANSSLVANSTSGIDKVIVANAVVTTLWANGAAGSNGQVLVTNGSAIYWGTGTSGANTQIQFNDSGVANATAGFTFDKTSNTLFVANLINTTTVNAATHSVGTNFIANSTAVKTSGYITAANGFLSNGNYANAFTAGIVVDYVTNNGRISTATGDSVTIYHGGVGTTPSLVTNTTGLYATAFVNATSFNVGTATISNSIGVYTTGTVNGSIISVGSSVIANTTGIYTTGTVNSPSYSVGTTFTANSTLVNAIAINVVNQINTATIYATTSANIASQVYANASGVFVANTTGTVNAANISVGTSFIANSTKITFTGANIDATSAFLKVADAVVSGNLTVQGTVTTINTQQLVVNDNIFEISSNNTTTDVVDAGFYSPAGNSSAIWYSGMARIAASSTNTNPVFRIFVSNTNPNTSATIDTTANTRTGTLQAYLQPYGTGGAFVSNATNVSIVANSTLAVTITANTLALSSALPGTSGGTGLASIANNSLIFGNTTNGFNTLAFNATAGYVLQSNGTAITYDVLDGGFF